MEAPNHPTQRPRLLFARNDGAILDHPRLLAAGVAGGSPRLPGPESWVPLPRGSDLFLLPGRTALGIDPDSGSVVEFEEQGEVAVSAFLAPAWNLLMHPAYRTRTGAPTLPLYAYCAVGFAEDRFWVPALRVDPDRRQDPWRFDEKRLETQVGARLAREEDNPVLQQLERCAMEYKCRAAQNFFIGRHEAPLPTSMACNSSCVGCISLQPDGEFRASHDRLRRAPSAQDVAAVALSHLARVPDGVVSFGQGCEGEPLLGRELLPESVRLIRRESSAGIINCNTNGSLPEVVEAMCREGLDAIRVSLNSPRSEIYDAYYRPKGYRFEDLVLSLEVMRRHDRYRSINYLVFPGVTDTDEELAAMRGFIDATDLEFIQMRNLNIDPELYGRILPPGSVHEGMGLARFMECLRESHPHLGYGYFNPSRESWESLRRARAASAGGA